MFGNESFIPDPPSLSSANYILIDSATNRVLANLNEDEHIEPASITKIMTGYIVSDQIQDGFLSLDDQVLISENCWRKKGSRMFIEESSRVSLLDLIKGMVIQSGNDATCAIAEHVAGSEDNFVDLMTRYANRMELTNTSFVNPSGWPDPEHYSSAKDIAKLSMLLIKDFPEHYSLYKEKWFTYNNIRQRNRNALLWQDDSIDGLKTGHTETAGFCLASSGVREQTRLIAVTLKSSSEKSRLTDNRRLLDYGFHAPTTYFPLLVPECFLIEPTETEDKSELDGFVEAMKAIRKEMLEDPEVLRSAPHTLPVRRLDDVKAARELNLAWSPS